MSQTSIKPRKLIRLKEAWDKLGVKHSTFYEKYVNTGLVRLVETGPTTRRAVEHEIDELIDQMIEERNAKLTGGK